jgi:hypothetical protein
MGLVGQAPLHFKEETISLCHPSLRSGSRAGQSSFAALRMTLLNRLRLTRTSSSLQCSGGKPCQASLARTPVDYLQFPTSTNPFPSWSSNQVPSFL